MKRFQASGFLLCTLLLAIITLATNRCTDGAAPQILPLKEGYKPDHAIEFPHDIHAKIDCKHCHNSEIDVKKAGIPLENICLECHK